MKPSHHNSISKFTYYSITVLGIVLYLAGRAAAEVSPLKSTFEKLTINSMAPATEKMEATIPPQAQSMFGGLTKVSCQIGQSPATCLPLGFLNTAFGVGKFTPQTAAAAAGKTSLTSTETLATATPWLGKITVKDALAGNPALAEILPQSALDLLRKYHKIVCSKDKLSS
jgi:hypothetical protein